MVDDRLRGDARDGRDDVVGGEAAGFAARDERVGVAVAEDFAAGRFGRVEGEVGDAAEEVVDEGLVDGAARAHRAVLVVFLLPVGVVPHHGVDEDVAGAGVEVVAGVHAAGFAGGDEADVGDAADVLTRAEFGGMMEEECVEESDEGCALTAGGLVGDPEVGDGGDAGAGGEDGALRHGEGGFDVARFGDGAEPDGLAVGTDGVDAGEGDVVGGGECVDGGGEGLAEEDVDFGELFGRGGVVEDHVHDAFLEREGHGGLAVLEDVQFTSGLEGRVRKGRKESERYLEEFKMHWRLWRFLLETTQRAINPVLGLIVSLSAPINDQLQFRPPSTSRCSGPTPSSPEVALQTRWSGRWYILLRGHSVRWSKHQSSARFLKPL